MAINFCQPCFQPRIHCDKVCTDGYEVENLIKETGRGFLCERFIKPPVNVVLEFPCNIEIHSVVVNPVLGSQKTTGIELLCQSVRNRPCWLSAERQPTTVASTNGIFSPVGRWFSNDVHQISFKNYSFRSRPPYTSLSFCSNSLTQGDEIELRSHNSALLRCSSHVMLRLVRTSGGGIPAIRSIQVWGQPSASCDQDVVNRVLHVRRNVFDNQGDKANYHSRSETVGNNKRVDGNCIIKSAEVLEAVPVSNHNRSFSHMTKDGVEIPAEFLDPLTCEVMSLPVLLPSGHTVDQVTLDKHATAESSWGRSASDPFTGVLFSRNSKPVSNISLKARIDKFLLENNVDISEVARTIGSRKDILSHHNSNWLRNGLPEDETRESSGEHSLKTHRQTTPCQTGTSTGIVDSEKRKSCVECDHPLGKRCKVETPPTKKSHTSHHLNSSLAAAISSTLTRFPSHRKPQKAQVVNQQSVDTKTRECRTCGDAYKSGYILKCGHFMCRNCVLHSDDKVCVVCSSPWSTSDVTRIHVN